jgi:hypothetical protein
MAVRVVGAHAHEGEHEDADELEGVHVERVLQLHRQRKVLRHDAVAMLE